MAGGGVLSLAVLVLLLDSVRCGPALRRAPRDIPLDLEALAEMPVEHFGLVDEYGVLPKHPSFHHRVTRNQPKGLAQAGKSKRDGPDIEEFYYDDIM